MINNAMYTVSYKKCVANKHVIYRQEKIKIKEMLQISNKGKEIGIKVLLLFILE